MQSNHITDYSILLTARFRNDGVRKNPFTDVPVDAFCFEPVLWAVERGITNGMDADSFGTTAVCNRAQIVTFRYRVYHILLCFHKLYCCFPGSL